MYDSRRKGSRERMAVAIRVPEGILAEMISMTLIIKVAVTHMIKLHRTIRTQAHE